MEMGKRVMWVLANTSVVTSKEASLQVTKKNQKYLLQPSFILKHSKRERERKKKERERRKKRGLLHLRGGPMNNVRIGVMWASSHFHDIWDNNYNNLYNICFRFYTKRPVVVPEAKSFTLLNLNFFLVSQNY